MPDMAPDPAESARSIVLVEGISDQIAVETAAARLGRDLVEDAVVVLPMGGAQAAARFVRRFLEWPAIRLTGLCDSAEERFFDEAFAQLPPPGGDYFVCAADLEEELIRAVGRDRIEDLLSREDDLRAFRTLQKQREWRDEPFERQIHRWLRSVARRNLRYARLLVIAAPDGGLPRPLVELVDRC